MNTWLKCVGVGAPGWPLGISSAPMAQSAYAALLALVVSERRDETHASRPLPCTIAVPRASPVTHDPLLGPCMLLAALPHPTLCPPLFTRVPYSLRMLCPAALPQTANFFIQFCTARAVFNNFLRLAWPHAGSMLTGLFRSLTCLCRPRSLRDATLIHMVPSGRIPSWYNGILQVGARNGACVSAGRQCMQLCTQ